MVMDRVKEGINWLKEKWSERSTWDGTMLLVMGVIVLAASPFMKYAAMAAIAYGAYRIWEEEKD
jgi:hypothetical protein